MISRYLPAVLAITLGILVVAIPIGYRSHMSTKYRNFRVVEPGVLYRSGQLSPTGFEKLAQEYGFKTVISLREQRDDGKVPPDKLESALCESMGIKHVVLAPANWYGTDEKPAAVDSNIVQFLNILDDPAAQPVLVHCFAGIHRTGGYVAVYRMEMNGWSAYEAIEEMKGMGTVRTTFDDEIPNYLEDYTRGKLRKKH